MGGYAVSHHGFPRYTEDIDVWIGVDSANADRMVEDVREFGFDTPELTTELFTRPGRITRMGKEPVKIEVMTSISGAEFESCYPNRVFVTIGDIDVPFISLADLRRNKASTGRAKDLGDLENLPEAENG